MKKKQNAFTLIELIVTMVILAILAAIAAPSLAAMVANNRSASLGREIAAGINLARAEAIKRGGRVSICVSSNGASCAAAGTSWSAGWMIFVDSTTSAIGAPVVAIPIQHRQGDSRTSVTVVKGSTAQSYLRFTSMGMLARAATDTGLIVITSQYSGCTDNNASRLEVGLGGRISQSKVNCS